MLKAVLAVLVFLAVDLTDALFVQPIVTSDVGKCFQNPSDFENYCTNTLHGVTEKNRCYFFTETNSDWTNGWKSCQQYGGILAHILTGDEYEKISNYALATFGEASLRSWSSGILPLLGLHDSGADGAQHGTCRLTPTTFFASSEVAAMPELDITKTWLYRKHQCDANEVDDPIADGPNRNLCLFLGHLHQFILADAPNCPCYAPICEISNQRRHYVVTTQTCLVEEPMLRLSVEEAEECGQHCTDRVWCRSFDFVMPSDEPPFQCNLFTWAVPDATTVVNSTCFHYQDP